MHEPRIRPQKTVKQLWFLGNKSSVHQKILVSGIMLILLNIALGFMLSNRGDTEYSSINNLTITISDSLLLLSVCSIGGLVFLMFFFIKSIANPLVAMEKTTRKLANGDLDQLMPIQADDNDPIGKIGENVHELAINLQEILLLVWNLSEQDLGILNKTVAMVKKDNNKTVHEDVLTNLLFLMKHREETQDLVQQFVLFNVAVQGKKLIAKADTASL